MLQKQANDTDLLRSSAHESAYKTELTLHANPGRIKTPFRIDALAQIKKKPRLKPGLLIWS
jgi:hypothetical protein